MRFAIALLTVICIASIIGTVLQQHEQPVAYIDQFGPFWAQFFDQFGLYQIYGSSWFIVILGFLVVSLSLCIARHAPKMLADMRSFRTKIRLQAFKAFPQRGVADLDAPPDAMLVHVAGVLGRRRWRAVVEQREGGRMVAARAGGVNRLGYLATHAAIVLICLGGLFDGDLMTRVQMWLGGKTPYMGSGLISQVPANHRLSPSSPSFRGNVFVSEGSAAGTALIAQPGGGVIVQELPFSIELKKFIVDYYDTGMPKRFASDIVIHDRETNESIPATVEVNHPASYRGVSIYQSSFDDGGSKLQLQLFPLAGGKAQALSGTVGDATPLQYDGQSYRVEFTGLRVINVEDFGRGGADQPVDARGVNFSGGVMDKLGASSSLPRDKQLRNIGPSFSYIVRDSAGQAHEFNNYMAPVVLNDSTVPVFLLGVRERPDAPYRYLRVPADDEGSMTGWLAMRSALLDPQARREAARRYAEAAVGTGRPDLLAPLEASASRALDLFAGVGAPAGTGGLQAVAQFMESSVPAAEREQAAGLMVRIINGTLRELSAVARERSGLKALPDDQASSDYLSQATLALSDAFHYPVPLVLELQDFQQVQASIFQVTRSPGRWVVYGGCLLLVIGVFVMFYVRQRRLWVWVAPRSEGGGTHVEMAYGASRRSMDTDGEFESIKKELLETKT